ncbi:MAG: hypothetical protein WCT01_04260 [Candidatus Shapirobacteria bacterium]
MTIWQGSEVCIGTGYGNGSLRFKAMETGVTGWFQKRETFCFQYDTETGRVRIDCPSIRVIAGISFCEIGEGPCVWKELLARRMVQSANGLDRNCVNVIKHSDGQVEIIADYQAR